MHVVHTPFGQVERTMGRMREFTGDILSGIRQAARELLAAHSTGDEHGVEVLSARLRYLLGVAKEHGVEVAELPQVLELLDTSES